MCAVATPALKLKQPGQMYTGKQNEIVALKKRICPLQIYIGFFYTYGNFFFFFCQSTDFNRRKKPKVIKYKTQFLNEFIYLTNLAMCEKLIAPQSS